MTIKSATNPEIVHHFNHHFFLLDFTNTYLHLYDFSHGNYSFSSDRPSDSSESGYVLSMSSAYRTHWIGLQLPIPTSARR